MMERDDKAEREAKPLPLVLTDVTGTSLTLHPPVARVVSLVPSITETVFALGAGSALVGRTRYCIHPQPEVRQIENIGGTKDPVVARIVSLKPDVVLANREENREADVKAMREAGLAVHVCEPVTPNDSLELVAVYGAMFDRIDESVRIVVKGEAALDYLRREAEEREQLDLLRVKARGKPRVACLIWRDPWMAVGHGTYIGAMIEALGGTNVFADASERYLRIEVKDLVTARPDLVLLPSEPFHFKQAHVEELAALAPAMPASIHRGIRLCNGEDLSWFGARTPEALVRLSEVVRW